MRKILTKIALTASIGLALAFTLSCGKHDPDDENEILVSSSSRGNSGNPYSSSSVNTITVDSGTFKDARDDQEYKWVKIGTQTWMAQNLNYFEPWIGPTRGNKCYNNKDENCKKYGRLYEWDDAIRICPDGWHLPSKAEWDDMISFVGSDAGKKLKSTSSDWRSGTGIDTYGFGALPGGALFTEYEGVNTKGYWWTATESYDEAAWPKIMTSEENGVLEAYGQLYMFGLKTLHYSVRCVKGTISDPPITYGELTDKRDNQKYSTVKIGTQNWMAQNLNYAEKGICYNNKETNCDKYGRLYSWTVAMDISEDYNTKEFKAPPGQHQGICPDGWHLPTRTEWNVLLDYIGDNYAGKKLKARRGDWGDGYGTDTYGFGALPGGALSTEYEGINTKGYWWTATESYDEAAWPKIMTSEENKVLEAYGQLYMFGLKTLHYSIRCVED